MKKERKCDDRGRPQARAEGFRIFMTVKDSPSIIGFRVEECGFLCRYAIKKNSEYEKDQVGQGCMVGRRCTRE